MNVWAILLIVALQTNTPTPVPTETPFLPIAFPTLASPTPIPTSTPFVLPTSPPLTGDLIYQLATAESALQAAPADLGASVPAQNGSEIFARAKWLLSTSTAAELFGPFAPLVTHILTAITLVIVLAVVAFLVMIAVFIIRFVVWIVTLILKFIPFFG